MKGGSKHEKRNHQPATAANAKPEYCSYSRFCNGSRVGAGRRSLAVARYYQNPLSTRYFHVS